MASLRNIMNDDDGGDQQQHIRQEQPPYPGMQHHAHPHAGSSSAGYPAIQEHPMYPVSMPPTSRRGSQYSVHSQGHEYHPHPGHHAMASSSRHNSASGEMMEYDYGHPPVYGQQPTYGSSSPMRPGAFVPNPADLPVKRTPITGRVSRAKKGVPVHTCDLCRPPKTFTRAEHLRRHQLSHQPPGLTCPVPGCNKVFHRKDLLDRHQQRHDQDDRSPGSADSAHTSPHGREYSSSPRSSHQHMPSLGGMGSNQPYLGSSSQPGSSSVKQWPHAKTAVGAMTTGSGRMDRPDMHQHQQTRPLAPIQNTYGMDTRIQHSPEGLQTAAAIVKSSEFSSQTVGNQPPPSWQESPEISSATGSSFSTPSDIVALVQKPQSRSSSTDWEVRRNSVLFRSPTAIPAYTSNSQSMRPDAAAINTYATSSTTLDQSLRDVFQERSASITSSLRTPMFGGPGLPITATSSGMLLAAPPPVSPALSVFSGLTLPVPAVHNAGFAFMEPLSTTLKQSLRESIPIYIDVYWDKVNAMYPIIHRPSFKEARLVDNEPVSTLHCAMAAVATQFLSHEDHRINGNQLHMYTSQKLREAFGMTLSHSTHPRPEEFTAFHEQTWPMDLLQATILFEYYSRFRGRDKDAYKPSALFQLVYYKLTHDQAMFETGFQSSMTWDQWIDTESRRRLISACFLLDVHSMRYFEQQQSCPIAFQYAQPETLPVYLFTRSKAAWEASSIKNWRSMHTASHHAQRVGEVLSQSPATIREYQSCPFDASILLSAHVLQLPPRASATRLDLIADASTVDIDSFPMADTFSNSAVAFTYLALHFAPLHVVLSVSGDSWVFNRKVLRAASFAQHQKQLATWRDSGSANVAVAFAARALRIFLGIYLDDKAVAKSQTSSILGRDISDFWGIYVCSLLCWAFGHAGRDCAASGGPSRSATLHWLYAASGTQPGQITRLSGRRNAQGAVGLARELLERDCLGGRSILLADAVGVLRKLEDGDTCKRF